MTMILCRFVLFILMLHDWFLYESVAGCPTFPQMIAINGEYLLLNLLLWQINWWLRAFRNVMLTCNTYMCSIVCYKIALYIYSVTLTHTHPFNGPFPGLPRWAGTRKVKTNLDFTEARDSEWQWHQLGHVQVCTLLQTDNHASTPSQAGCPSCHPAKCQSTEGKSL